MSSRHFRKASQQNNVLPAQPPDDSDDDYQPLYTRSAGMSHYAGLEISSHSESERQSERSEEEQPYVAPLSVANRKKNLRKRGKGKGKLNTAGLDEVERSVKEVNALLGTPPPVPEKPVNQALDVLVIDPKHLNVTNELRRLFGPEEGSKRGRGTPQHRALLLKRVLIHPNKETPVFEFNNSGLSMIKYKDVDDRMYFVFNHSDKYQKMHRNFLRRFDLTRDSADLLMSFEDIKQRMHVEAMLEIADRLFLMEENSVGNEIVENVVTFLQYVAHPLFILSQNNVRLEYKFLENRPFHVAMLKYIYLLTNKACHRTALEIAKMLLLIDPSDPLAILSVIDILAIRSREHDWLIEAVKYFDKQREACLLFNIKYSYSLAHFHVAHKNKRDFAEADRLVREAILAFPNVFLKILECCNIHNPGLVGHEIFKPDPPTSWAAGGAEVFMMYARMTQPRWNEPAVMSWLLKNATELCEQFNTDPAVRESAHDWGVGRKGLFQVWPQEYLRHMSVFSNMAKLIIDVPLTTFNQPTCAWDPLFDKAVNRYSYSYQNERRANTTSDDPVWPVYRPDPSRIFFERPVHLGAPRFQVQPQMVGYPPVPFQGSDMFYNGPQGHPMPPFMQPIHPGVNVLPFEQPRFSPGVSLQGWYMNCSWPMIQSAGPNIPMNLDLNFDDNDPEFSQYDYSQDNENFARDEREMEEAMNGAVDLDEEDDISEAMDAACLDERIHNIFKPSNAT